MSETLPDITAPPAADQHIIHDGVEYATIKEGLAHILIPASAAKTPQTTPRGDNQPQSVFYNPIQQFNRDLSVLAIKAYGEELLEKKRMKADKARQKQSTKGKDKKRKREEDGAGEPSRKAGKIEGKSQITDAEATQAEVDAHLKGDAKSTIDIEHEQKPVKDIASTEIPSEASCPQYVTSETLDASAVRKPASTILPPSFTILDALSATGLRALRYAQEIPFSTSITANDLLPSAAKTIQMNVQHNRVEGKVEALTSNASAHMHSVAYGESEESRNPSKMRPKYDVIDLDPYGTAVPFLDAAVQSVRDDGGLLCVTCTDAGVWASNGYPEKSFSLYGGVPIKGLHSHEGGLRLILHAIASSAARYGLAMEPLLSLSIDFYARVFVKIHKSPADVKFLAGKTMVVYNCDSGCGAWTTQMLARNKLAKNKNGNGYFWKHVFGLAPTTGENCVHCGTKTHVAGPMYAGPLHSPEFIKKILSGLSNVSRETYQTYDRIEGMLSVALEETLPPLEENTDSPTSTGKTNKYDPAIVDPYPFFFIPSTLAKVVHCVTPHENALRGALRHLGYRVTRSHTKGGTIKTDAPWSVIWEVMREWVKQKAPIKEGAVKKETAGYKILKLGEDKSAPNGENGAKQADETTSGQKDQPSKDKPSLTVVFDEQLGKEKDAKKLVRYQVNPRENWGPMNRAKGRIA
ncbi:Uncharacterized protein BP5553_09662 [Venustampulla echinocandica]|uniref:tRNA (guanine(26)-N(2))-dimethyltransferase n=1 Tax=Venustampulla echinocandica TaxID=2656787 RepID=A0A370TBN3_9HELO|nr:Uncharacterized protein BP5553_09662 [Venustampulla echinocandica]RDL31453.1 Uncharacterized protein BP5553_09662 [Venustampulla echinocandica]